MWGVIGLEMLTQQPRVASVPSITSSTRGHFSDCEGNRWKFVFIQHKPLSSAESESTQEAIKRAKSSLGHTVVAKRLSLSTKLKQWKESEGSAIKKSKSFTNFFFFFNYYFRFLVDLLNKGKVGFTLVLKIKLNCLAIQPTSGGDHGKNCILVAANPTRSKPYQGKAKRHFTGRKGRSPLLQCGKLVSDCLETGS